MLSQKNWGQGPEGTLAAHLSSVAARRTKLSPLLMNNYLMPGTTRVVVQTTQEHDRTECGLGCEKER